MRNIFIFLAFFTFQCIPIVNAQDSHFIKSGKIEFEKSANMFLLIKKNIQQENSSLTQLAYDQYVKTHSQFSISRSTLTFSNRESFYVQVESPDQSLSNFFDIPIADHDNSIYTDFSKEITISQKTCLGEMFLVSDSLKKIKWKITDETREIAGFMCRRANGIILDSIYVVAFFTNQILVPSGPVSFSGLPGMILGIALPHENVTWFASKVLDISVDQISTMIPKKGIKISGKQLHLKLKSILRNQDFHSENLIKAIEL